MIREDEDISKTRPKEVVHKILMALVSRGGSASNSSPAMFALSYLLSITEEHVESLGDEELTLVATRFMRFHNNRMCRRHGGSKDGCYNCGDPDHFVASYPKKGKTDSGPSDHHIGRRKGK
jgi:hypothetical protein